MGCENLNRKQVRLVLEWSCRVLEDEKLKETLKSDVMAKIDSGEFKIVMLGLSSYILIINNNTSNGFF